MKLVVLDGYTENPGDLSWEALRAFGEVTIYERTSYVDAPIIAERLQDADIAVVNKTPITKQTLDACPHLKLICVLATGYNVVDCACAKEKGIPVCNVPAYGTASVSQQHACKRNQQQRQTKRTKKSSLFLFLHRAPQKLA